MPLVGHIDDLTSEAAGKKPAPASVEVRVQNCGRARAAVVTWDLAHNPVGRAYVLYRLLEARWDVELIGPMWPRFGHELWQPIRNESLSVRSFAATDLVAVWTHGGAIARACPPCCLACCSPSRAAAR